MKSAGAVVLAAGFSRRLGNPKQEAVLGGSTLLERAVQVALDAELSPVLVVVRDERWLAMVQRLGAEGVLNREAAEGMASSVRLGIRRAAALNLPGAVVMTCDQPLLRPEHLRQLCQQPLRVTASAYAGRQGVPAYFPASAFDALLQLTGDAGARDLLRGAPAIEDESLSLDIDTSEDLERARERLG